MDSASTTDLTPDLTIEKAHRLLKQFDCIQPPSVNSQADFQAIQAALCYVAQHSDYQILGICADSVEQACQALQSYGKALGYAVQFAPEPMAGAVYLKFNPKGSCYASPYEGKHRGVLVACQSAYSDGINEMYGHLPLDLFAEGA